MASKINKKFVFILVGVLAILIGGTAAFVLLVVRKSTTELEAMGDRHIVMAENTAADPAADPDELAGARAERGRNYRLAAESYGKAWNRNPENADLLIKYIDARSKMPVRDQFQAKRVLGEIMGLTRRTTELRPDDDQLLENFYQMIYRWAREFGVPSFYNDLYSLTSTRLETYPDNIPAMKFRGISQAMQLSDSMDRARQQDIRKDLETVLAVRPEDTDVLHYLARWHLYDAGRSERAAPGSAAAEESRQKAVAYADRALAAAQDDPLVQVEYFNVMLALIDAQRRMASLSGNEAGRQEALANYNESFRTIEPVLDRLEARLLENPSPPLAVQQVAEILPRVDKQRELMAAQTDGQTPAADDGNKPTHLARTERLLRSAAEARPDMLLYRLMLANVLKLQLELDAAHEIYVLARDHPIAGNFEASLRDQVLRQQAIYEVANIELIRAEAAGDPERRKQLLADADKAVDDLESVTDKDARVLMLRGKIAMLRGQNTQAMQYIDQASNLYQDSDIEALLLSARARQSEKQWGAAVDRLERVLELVQGGSRQDIKTNIRLQLAEMLLRSRKMPQAYEQIQTVLALEPGNIVATRLLSQYHAAEKDYAKAIDALQAIPGHENNPEVARTLAELYKLNGEDDRSLALLREQLEKNPGDLRLIQQLLPRLEDGQQKLDLLDQAAAAGADARAIGLLRSQVTGRENQTPMTLDEMVAQVTDQSASAFDQAIRKAQIYWQYQRIDQARTYFEQAKKLEPENDRVLIMGFDFAIRDEDYDAARRLVSTAGKRDLDLAEGNFLRGQLAAAEGNLRQALANYDQALKLRPIFDEGWRQYADLLLRSGDAYEAVAAYEKSLDQKPDNLRTLLGLANAQDTLGRRDQVLETLRTAVSYDPNNAELFERYVRYEQQYGSADAARKLREQIAASQPQNLQNRLSLATLAAEAKDTDEALSILDELAADQPDSPQIVGTRATVMRIADRPEDGRKVIEDYLAQRGDQATADDYSLLARYLLSTQQVEESLAAYQQAIEVEDPELRPASRELADVLFNFGQIDPAIAIYQELFDAADEAQRRVLGPRLAEALLRVSRGDQALAVLDKLEVTATTESLRALHANQQGNRDEAMKHINLALGKDDRNPMSYLQRANLLATNPATLPQAMDDIRQALSINPDFIEALAMQARLQAQSGQLNDASYTLGTLLDKAPGNDAARGQLVQIYLQTNRTADARGLVDEARKLSPDNVAWIDLEAQIAAAQGKPAQAIKAYEQLMEKQANPQTLAQLTNLYLQENQATQAQALLDEHPELVNASPVLQALRGRVLSSLGQADQAQRVFALALQRSESINQMSTVLDQVLQALGEEPGLAFAKAVESMPNPAWIGFVAANRMMAKGDFSAALSELRALENIVPASDTAMRVQVDRLTALVLLQSGDFAGSRDVYLRLLEEDPDNVEVLNNLAYILADELKDPQAAVPMAERAAKQAPDSAEVLDTLGWTYYQAGRIDDARKTLERSISLRPLPANTLHLGRVYMEAGDTRRARTLLEQAAQLADQAGDADGADQARRYLKQL